MRKEIPPTQPLTYALGEFGLALPTHAVGTYLLFFYTDHLGLAVSWAMLARGINTLWDTLNDPLMGYLSDRTNNPRGRRWPWLRVSLPLYVLVGLMLWTVPEGLEGPALFAYFLIVLLLFEGVATAAWVNHNALFPALFRQEGPRARANALRKALGLVALLLAVALSPVLYSRLGFAGMGLVWAAVAALALRLYFSRLREPPWTPPHPQAGFWPSVLNTLRNPSFRPLLLALALVQTALGLLMSGLPFFAKYTLGLPEDRTSLLFGTIFVAALLSTFAWPHLIQRLGGGSSLQAALWLFALALLPLWGVTGLATGMLVAAVVGFAVSGMLVLQDVVLAQVIDQRAEQTGMRQEGVHYGLVGVLGRLSGLLQSLIFATLTPLFGYVSGQQPGPDPETAFRFLIAGPPVLTLVLAVLALRRSLEPPYART
jgi:GPH family glycoside/pentoside/hexuronide:cation symporter